MSTAPPDRHEVCTQGAGGLCLPAYAWRPPCSHDSFEVDHVDQDDQERDCSERESFFEWGLYRVPCLELFDLSDVDHVRMHRAEFFAVGAPVLLLEHARRVFAASARVQLAADFKAILPTTFFGITGQVLHSLISLSVSLRWDG